jgi:hypothetical protein
VGVNIRGEAHCCVDFFWWQKTHDVKKSTQQKNGKVGTFHGSSF